MVKRKPLKNPPFTPFTRLQPQASHHNQNIQKQSWDVHFRAQSRKKTLIIHIYEEHTHSHWPEATCVNTNLTISSVKIELNNLNNKSEHVLIVGFLCEVFLKQMSLSKNGCPKNRLPMATLYIKHHFFFFSVSLISETPKWSLNDELNLSQVAVVQNMVMHRIARILGDGRPHPQERNCDSSRSKSW